VKVPLPKDGREAAKWVSGFIGVAAALIGALATLGVIGGSAPEGEALANAAAQVRDAGSSRVQLEMSVPGRQGAEGSTVEANGVLDYDVGRGSLRYELIDTEGGRLNADARFVGSRLYLRLGPDWGLAPDRPWVGATLDELQAAAEDRRADTRVKVLASFNFEGLTEWLEYLDRVGDVEEQGTERIGADETTEYKGLAHVGQADIRISAWIVKDEGILRKLLLTLQDNSTAELEFDDFGTEVHVDEPPPNRVIGLDELPPLS
jgi:hypothetical protein